MLTAKQAVDLENAVTVLTDTIAKCQDESFVERDIYRAVSLGMMRARCESAREAITSTLICAKVYLNDAQSGHVLTALARPGD